MQKNNYNKLDDSHLTPTNDFIFKKIFGTKGNEDITLRFVNDVLNEDFTKLVFNSSNILERNNINGKTGVLDVKATVLANDNSINQTEVDIEMQVVPHQNMANRLLWYWAKMFVDSVLRGQNYDDAKRVVCIGVLDFKLDILKDLPDFCTIWEIRGRKYTTIRLTDKFSICIIELEKLGGDIMAENPEEQKILNWANFIKNPDEIADEIIAQNKEIQKAKEELKRLREDNVDRETAFAREKELMDFISFTSSNFRKGMYEGMEKKTKEIIIKMYKNNMDEKQIAKILEIDIELVEQVVKEYNESK